MRSDHFSWRGTLVRPHALTNLPSLDSFTIPSPSGVPGRGVWPSATKISPRALTTTSVGPTNVSSAATAGIHVQAMRLQEQAFAEALHELARSVEHEDRRLAPAALASAAALPPRVGGRWRTHRLPETSMSASAISPHAKPPIMAAETMSATASLMQGLLCPRPVTGRMISRGGS